MRGLTQPVELPCCSPTERQPDKGESAKAVVRESNPANTNKVIGVVCSGDLAVERDTIKSTIAKGIAQRQDAVWVCLEPKSDRITHDVMISLGLEPVVLPLNDAWRGREHIRETRIAVVRVDECEQNGTWLTFQEPCGHDYDLRRQWRDCEMLLCDELIVFHKRTGNSPWRDRHKSGLYEGRLFVVEMGPEPKRAARKTRKPVGV